MKGSSDVVFYTTEDYNKDDVFYCPQCLSLAIRSLEDSSDYCETCGHTDIKSTSIEEWESLYIKKYNKKLIEKNNGRG